MVKTAPAPAGQYCSTRLWYGEDGCDACETHATAGWVLRKFATAVALATCRSIRSGSVSTPHSVRYLLRPIYM